MAEALLSPDIEADIVAHIKESTSWKAIYANRLVKAILLIALVVGLGLFANNIRKLEADQAVTPGTSTPASVNHPTQTPQSSPSTGAGSAGHGTATQAAPAVQICTCSSPNHQHTTVSESSNGDTQTPAAQDNQNLVQSVTNTVNDIAIAPASSLLSSLQ